MIQSVPADLHMFSKYRHSEIGIILIKELTSEFDFGILAENLNYIYPTSVEYLQKLVECQLNMTGTQRV